MEQRLDYFDIAKGIAILGVVYSHTLHFKSSGFQYSKVFIGTYMVVAFYIISGCLFAYKNSFQLSTKDFVIKKIRTLLVPFLFFSALQTILDLILIYTGNDSLVIATNLVRDQIIIGDIYKTVSFKGIGTLWFLSSIFIGEVFFFLITKKIKLIKYKNLVFILLAIVIPIVSWELYRFDNGSLMYEIATTPIIVTFRGAIGTIYIYFGYLIYSKINKVWSSMEVYKMITYSAIFFVMCFILVYCFTFSNSYDINHLLIGNPAVFYAYGITGSMFLIFISMLLSRISNMRFLKFCSKNSLIIMALHYPLRPIIVGVIDVTLKYIGINAIGMGEIIVMILLIFILIPSSYILNKYCPHLVGK